MTVTAGDPVIMLQEPIPATQKVLARAGMSIDDIDLYEVNEAFAPIPLGASGTKLMATLIHALKVRGKRYGLQTMCEGGGIEEAVT